MLKKFREKYTSEMFDKGLKALADTIRDELLYLDEKFMAICTDPSRRKFKMFDSNGNVIEDTNAIRLLETIVDAVLPVLKETYSSKMKKLEDEYHEDKRNGVENAFDRNVTKCEKVDRLNIEYLFFAKHEQNTPFLEQLSISLYKKL